MSDFFHLIRAANTAADELGLDTASIIEHLQDWQALAEFSILAADGQSIELQFTRLPSDLDAFIEDLRDFCPFFNQVLDPGNMEEMIDSSAHTKLLDEAMEGVDLSDDDFAVEIFKNSLRLEPILRLYWE